MAPAAPGASCVAIASDASNIEFDFLQRVGDRTSILAFGQRDETAGADT